MQTCSSHLTFKKLTAKDFQLYALLAMNKDVMKYITGDALTLDEAELRFQKALNINANSDDAGFFIVREKANQDFIGVTKLVQLADNQLEVGYMLLPKYWGKGYATAMVEFLISLAKQKHIGELIGIVDPENQASIRVLSKLGFHLYETGEIDGLAAAYYKLNLTNI